MIPRSKFPPLHDGVLFICEPESDVTDFNAVKNATKQSDMTKIEKLDFAEKSKREQDLDFAESQGRTLSLKVETRLRDWLTKAYPVMIGNVLYSIIHIDFDRSSGEMYLYLEEARKFNE